MPVDLKQTLEPQAIEWLKVARPKLMCDLERHYYSLDGSRHTPLSQPLWVQKPDVYSLTLGTNSLAAVFEPFRLAIAENIHTS
ncbi:hypothetical protein B0H13DRAFT_2356210 [Mycena leptocephala]|nr:hypothetical protein B0H13DRAFT_2356210 [Mycena leptocephala]